jgi:prepilin-type N-terminal cleavage/methylation domain-containing protein
MTTCDRRSGFTLLELVIVLGVLGLLLAAAVPLASAVIEADRRQEARGELQSIAIALESHYHEHAAFPATLAATTFVGIHLQPGVAGTTTIDPFAIGQPYVYSVDAVANTATVYSIGENGADDGIGNEELTVVVHGAVPGLAKTWQRLRLVVEVLANHIEAGGAVAGAWPQLRAAIGLSAPYDQDGFGTTLQWDAATHALTSAGPDRAFGTADDITL